jgi:hypothetical protein
MIKLPFRLSSFVDLDLVIKWIVLLAVIGITISLCLLAVLSIKNVLFRKKEVDTSDTGINGAESVK